jgi:DNA-directed RNA polymerase subunit omega
MARITVEDCLAREPNRFALVLLAAKRTKQILSGAKALLSNVRNKPVVTSLREIAAGEVHFMTEEDMKKAKEREMKQREAALSQGGASPEERQLAQDIMRADELFIDAPRPIARDTEDDEDLDEEIVVKKGGGAKDDDSEEEDDDDDDDDDLEDGEGADVDDKE